MTKTVEFCFDFVSPTCYIAYHVLPRIAERAGATTRWTPVFLGGIMQAVGNHPPGTVKAKGRWMQADLERWVKLYDLPFKRNSSFPVNTLAILRGAIAYGEDPVIRPYCDAMFKAMWVEDRNMADQAEIAAVVEPLGIDPEVFAQRIADPAVKEALKANTQGAIDRGAFGAPTFFVDGTMHFGQDRLWMVAEDLGVTIHEALSAEPAPA